MQAINLTQVQETIDQRDGRALSSACSKVQRIASEAGEIRQTAVTLTAKLWPKMGSLYGHKFAAQFGESPDDGWITALQGLAGRQIADGLNKCLEWYPNWPPGAAAFRAMCLGKDPRNVDKDGHDVEWEHKLIEARTREFNEEMRRRRQLDLVDITRKERSREMGAETLTNLKAMFKGV